MNNISDKIPPTLTKSGLIPFMISLGIFCIIFFIQLQYKLPKALLNNEIILSRKIEIYTKGLSLVMYFGIPYLVLISSSILYKRLLSKGSNLLLLFRKDFVIISFFAVGVFFWGSYTVPNNSLFLAKLNYSLQRNIELNDIEENYNNALDKIPRLNNFGQLISYKKLLKEKLNVETDANKFKNTTSILSGIRQEIWLRIYIPIQTVLFFTFGVQMGILDRNKYMLVFVPLILISIFIPWYFFENYIDSLMKKEILNVLFGRIGLLSVLLILNLILLKFTKRKASKTNP